MSARLLAFFLFVWIIGIFLGSTYDGYSTTETWAGTGAGGYETSPSTALGEIGSAIRASQKLPIIGTIAYVVTHSQFWYAVYQILTWQWTFMANLGMVYWLIFFPFVAMGLFSASLLTYGLLTGNVTWD